MCKIISKIELLSSHPEYVITSLAAKGYLDFISDSAYLKLLYRIILKRKCNLKNPTLYNEKLQWLKLHDRRAEYSQMVDKWEVRKYITQKIGSEYLIPCYGVFSSCEEIEFEELPDKFVIKCTHDSGSVEICTNKTVWDKNKAVANIKKALKRNYYSAYREWPYKNVSPRIIVEEYLYDDVLNDLRDYKVMCFNGVAEIIELHENRYSDNEDHTQTFYSRNWEKLDIEQPIYRVNKWQPKPALLDKMLELSEKLSEGLYHARIDWYEVKGKLYFGEITFFDGSGFAEFSDIRYERYLGDLLRL